MIALLAWDRQRRVIEHGGPLWARIVFVFPAVVEWAEELAVSDEGGAAVFVGFDVVELADCSSASGLSASVVS